MKLNVLERLTLLQLVPKVKSNIVTWGMIDAVLDRLPLTEKEYKQFGVKQQGEEIIWNEKGSIETEIEIGEVVSDIIGKELDAMDKAEPPRIEKRHVSLYNKFVKK